MHSSLLCSSDSALQGDEVARRMSQSGYDLTPLTVEKKSELASKLTDHQRLASDTPGNHCNAIAYNTAFGNVTFVAFIATMPLVHAMYQDKGKSAC